MRNSLISAVTLALSLLMLPFGGAILFTTDGDCDIAPWCDGNGWPLWTGYVALALWAVVFIGMWYAHYRLRKDDEPF